MVHSDSMSPTSFVTWLKLLKTHLTRQDSFDQILNTHIKNIVEENAVSQHTQAFWGANISGVCYILHIKSNI